MLFNLHWHMPKAQPSASHRTRGAILALLLVSVSCMLVTQSHANQNSLRSESPNEPRGEPTTSGVAADNSATPAPAAHLLPLLSTHLSNSTQLGAGTLRWFGLQIYDAQLWSPAKNFSSDWKTAPLLLDLRYARAFRGEKIAARSIEEIQALGYGNTAQHLQWQQTLQRLIPNVEKGQHLTGIYLPNQSNNTARILFFANGKPIGTVDDSELAQAFMAIWLDERTSTPQLRQALLNGARRSSATLTTQR